MTPAESELICLLDLREGENVTEPRYEYEVEFVQQDGPPLTLKRIVIHMEADSHKEAEEQARLVLMFWVKEECLQFLKVRHCQAIRQVGKS